MEEKLILGCEKDYTSNNWCICDHSDKGDYAKWFKNIENLPAFVPV